MFAWLLLHRVKKLTRKKKTRESLSIITCRKRMSPGSVNSELLLPSDQPLMTRIWFSKKSLCSTPFGNSVLSSGDSYLLPFHHQITGEVTDASGHHLLISVVWLLLSPKLQLFWDVKLVWKNQCQPSQLLLWVPHYQIPSLQWLPQELHSLLIQPLVTSQAPTLSTYSWDLDFHGQLLQSIINQKKSPKSMLYQQEILNSQFLFSWLSLLCASWFWFSEESLSVESSEDLLSQRISVQEFAFSCGSSIFSSQLSKHTKMKLVSKFHCE